MSKNIHTPDGHCFNCLRPYPKGWKEKQRAKQAENIRKTLKDRKEQGLPVGRPKLRDDKKIAALRSEGYSIREISKITGYCTYSVHCSIRGK